MKIIFSVVLLGTATAVLDQPRTLVAHRELRRTALKSSRLALRGGAISPCLHLRGGIIEEEEAAVELIESERQLGDALETAGSKLVVVDFFAEWCGPCKQIAPVLESLARKAGDRVLFVKVDVDASKELAASKGVRSMPTLLFYRNNELVRTMVGADEAELRKLVGRELMHPLLRVASSEFLVAGVVTAYLGWTWRRQGMLA